MVTTGLTDIIATGIFTATRMEGTMQTEDIITMAGFTEKGVYHPDRQKKSTAAQAPSRMPTASKKNTTKGMTNMTGMTVMKERIKNTGINIRDTKTEINYYKFY